MHKILIVDNKSRIRETLKNGLLEAGYEVLTADNGPEGLEMFHTHKPAALLLDLKMPQMSGIDFLKKLPPGAVESHAIVILAGQRTNEEIERCYELGIQYFVNKPVNLFEMKGLVKRSIDLVETNARLRSLVENVPGVVWECDSELKFTFVAENVRGMLGFAPQDLLGRHISEFLVEEEIVEFYYKFQTSVDELSSKVASIKLRFINAEQQPVLLQLSANSVQNEHQTRVGMVGICHLAHEADPVSQSLDSITKTMLIRLNERRELIHADPDVQHYFPVAFEGNTPQTIFSLEIDEPTLVQFGFDQGEDLPFPVDLRVQDNQQQEHHFSLTLSYHREGPYLEAQLIPVDPNEKLTLMGEKIEQQNNVLQTSVMIDGDMQTEILIDCDNLTKETLGLLKNLRQFAFEVVGEFNLTEFKGFSQGKPFGIYLEQLRLLCNKLHGLKGTCGFLIPEAKEICHEIEEIPRRLLEHQLVFTKPLLELLQEFTFHIQMMLETYQNDANARFEISDWLQRIEQLLSNGCTYLGEEQEAYAQWIEDRSEDDGEIRTNREEEYLSVKQNGYESLIDHLKSLFSLVSEFSSQELQIKAGNVFNEFMETHQEIKKVPLDLSRYERLIPSLGQQYGKKVEFVYHDHGVHADREFWNALHEIFNHSLKNAVIHGIEKPEKRQKNSKSEVGSVSVKVTEDALNIFVTVDDDGRGIDLEQIKKGVLEKGLIPLQVVEGMSKEDLLNLVFLQGVSTAKTLDDNAGRGVGMNAVQESMKNFSGKCTIGSEKNKGSQWNFVFPKSNVSLPCFVVNIGEKQIAIPEENVDTFQDYSPEAITQYDLKPVIRLGDQIIPFMDTQQILGADAEGIAFKRILVLKSEQHRQSIVINRIAHHSTFPILPLPEEFKPYPAFLGATFLGNDTILVLNVASEIAAHSN